MERIGLKKWLKSHGLNAKHVAEVMRLRDKLIRDNKLSRAQADQYMISDMTRQMREVKNEA